MSNVHYWTFSLILLGLFGSQGTLGPSPAYSKELTAADAIRMFRSEKIEDASVVKLPLIGGLYAYSVANAYLVKARKQPPLFCQPQNLDLEPDTAISILDVYVSEHPQFRDDPFGATLLFALIEAFPCEMRN